MFRQTSIIIIHSTKTLETVKFIVKRKTLSHREIGGFTLLFRGYCFEEFWRSTTMIKNLQDKAQSGKSAEVYITVNDRVFIPTATQYYKDFYRCENAQPQ